MKTFKIDIIPGKFAVQTPAFVEVNTSTLMGTRHHYHECEHCCGDGGFTERGRSTGTWEDCYPDTFHDCTYCEGRGYEIDPVLVTESLADSVASIALEGMVLRLEEAQRKWNEVTADNFMDQMQDVAEF